MIAYFVAIAVEIPFMSTTFYTGPMVAHLGGGDISWILGLIVASGLYLLHRGRDVLPRTVVEATERPRETTGR